ncbi:MAG: cytidine deaminase [Bacteroidetes bacterium]|nr:cytidine deaminase [Bacteroidota bacterium]
MKNVSLNINYQEFDNEQELAEEDRILLSMARAAAGNAYAPYSRFWVGAAVRLANEVVVTGNNQENAAYPSGMCAERVALYAASARYPGIPVLTIAITAKSASFKVDYPIPPCGACRQVMAEYETSGPGSTRVILSGEKGKVLIFNEISSLLPFMFSKKEMNH